RGIAVVALIAAVKLVLQFYASGFYGFFIDELYYLACGQHLAWGYVDQPPLIAAIAHVSRAAFGESLRGIRFLPVLAGAVKVVFTALLAREIGAGRFAQVLAALCVLAAPGFLA